MNESVVNFTSRFSVNETIMDETVRVTGGLFGLCTDGFANLTPPIGDILTVIFCTLYIFLLLFVFVYFMYKKFGYYFLNEFVNTRKETIFKI